MMEDNCHRAPHASLQPLRNHSSNLLFLALFPYISTLMRVSLAFWLTHQMLSCRPESLAIEEEPRDSDRDSNSLLEGGSYMSEAKTVQ